MKTSESIAALRNARRVITNRDRKLARMKQRLDALIAKGGVELGSDMEEEMASIVKSHHPDIEPLPMSDFRCVFWNVNGSLAFCLHPINLYTPFDSEHTH